MVNVCNDSDVTQIFDHSFASGILEIARYCTRINRATEQDHNHLPQTTC
ncbi:putative cytoplasmic protein [Dickeya solani RNS 08.23.3.1.A]|nr:putative cytoplasmic protein [Dickeya solani RNS 08.23.3.1.A]